MDKEANINVAEKQRLRDAISEQVQRFLDKGGNITVLDDPGVRREQRLRGVTWHSDDPVPVRD